MKKCYRCNQEKLDKDFSKNKSRPDGLQSECRECRVNYGVDNILSRMFKGCRNRAIKLKLEFKITKEDLVSLNITQEGRCALTGKLLNWNISKRVLGGQRICPSDRVSIDRIDSSKGYTLDNIRLVTDMANRMKGVATDDELLEYCKLIISTKESKAD